MKHKYKVGDLVRICFEDRDYNGLVLGDTEYGTYRIELLHLDFPENFVIQVDEDYLRKLIC